ncbi:MAG TPA: hypothetical protein VGM92_11445 [Candidatus Kapabacteria bacterium]|jgi:hypothetical protein
MIGKYFSIAMALIVSYVMFGCSSTSSVPPALPKSVDTSTTHRYQLILPSSFTTHSDGNWYLWVRAIGDSTYYSVELDSSIIVSDSREYFGNITIPHALDSLSDAKISEETSANPKTPGRVLLSGQYSSLQSIFALSTNNVPGISGLSSASGMVTFTTLSNDTTRAKNEFYLLHFVNGVALPGSTLPGAPAGWRYGLWVIDTDFFPYHQFFYGFFTRSDSANLDPTNLDYPLPGGYNEALLTDPGATLEVTLEPALDPVGRPSAPSTLVIFQGKLSEFIFLNETLALQNVWAQHETSGMLSIQ